MASNPQLKRGDLVRTSFAISGHVVNFLRERRTDWVVINTGERYTRKVPLDSVSLISECERREWTKDESGEITGSLPCHNAPEVRMNNGIWVCNDHVKVAR